MTNKSDLQAKGVGLNLMELNDLYDHLWNLGTVLQGDRNYKPNPTSNTNPNWLSLKVKKLFLFSTTTTGHPWPRVRHTEGPTCYSIPIRNHQRNPTT